MEDLLHRREAEIVQEADKPACRCFEIEIVRRRNTPRQRNPRMVRVDLPGMEIEHRRLAEAIDAAEAGARDGVGKDAEVRSSSDGDVLSEQAPGGDGEL